MEIAKFFPCEVSGFIYKINCFQYFIGEREKNFVYMVIFLLLILLTFVEKYHSIQVDFSLM